MDVVFGALSPSNKAASTTATDVASALEGMPRAHVPSAYHAKGSYFALTGCSSPFRGLVYPLPLLALQREGTIATSFAPSKQAGALPSANSACAELVAAAGSTDP